MKKALVILLALTMVMSMFAVVPFGASAAEELAIGAVAADYKPEGTAIKTAEEFAAMAADGQYYLANDITVSATYANDFIGTFDGNGKTITTSVALFAALDGTVKNLTIEGGIVYDIATTEYKAEGYTGALANIAGNTAPAYITNVVNKAHLLLNVGAGAGLVGMISNDEQFEVIFTDCANYGNITGGKKGDNGGIAGKFDGDDKQDYYVKFINCSNYGTINAAGRPGGILGVTNASTWFEGCYNAGEIQSTANYCGGIVGRCNDDGGKENKYAFIDCVNDGDVVVYQSQGGGMMGYAGDAMEYIFKNCVNNGHIYAGEKNRTAKVNLGGFIGGMLLNNDNGYWTDSVLFENCVNNGDIGLEGNTCNADLYRAGFIGGNTGVEKSFKMINCVNNGDVYAETPKIGYAGGLVSYIRVKGKGTSVDEVSFVNCINNGNIITDDAAGGIVGHAFSGSYYAIDIIAHKCGNTGDITVTGISEAEANAVRAGGIFGYVNAGWNRGATITCSFNTGNITGTKMVSGLLGYTNDLGYSTVIQNNYVAGKITSSWQPVLATDGMTVAVQTPYYFETAAGNKYFMAPATGTVNITNGVLKFTAKDAFGFAADYVTDGATVVKQTIYKYADATNNKTWLIPVGNEVGVISIKEAAGKAPVAIVANTDLCVVEWNGAADNKVIDNYPVSDTIVNGASALLWNNGGCEDLSSNYVLTGAAPVDAIMGIGNKLKTCYYPDVAVHVTESDFHSGKVAYELNNNIGEVVFFQNLDAELFNVDLYPTTDKSHAKVVEVGGVLTNEVFDTTNDSGSPSTGDATIYVVVALAVSTISLAAVAVIRKNKEN